MSKPLPRVFAGDDYDYQEAARRLRMSVRKLQQLVKAKKIRPMRPTLRMVRFNDEILNEFRQSVKVTA